MIQPLLVANLEIFWGTFVIIKCIGEAWAENLVKFYKIEQSNLKERWYQSLVIASEVYQLRALIMQYFWDLKTKDYDGTTLMSFNILYLLISLSLSLVCFSPLLSRHLIVRNLLLCFNPVIFALSDMGRGKWKAKTHTNRTHWTNTRLVPNELLMINQILLANNDVDNGHIDQLLAW